MSNKTNDNKTIEVAQPVDKNQQMQLDFSQAVQYASTAKLILRDLQKNNADSQFFSRYKKEEIMRWLESPASLSNQKRLREASNFIYESSGHYKRLCNYFAYMSKLSYVVIPYKLNTSNLNNDRIMKRYQQTVDLLEVMNIKHEFQKITATMVREGISYNYEYSTPDSYYLLKLDPEYCTISSVEDGVWCVAFDFSYFKKFPEKLEHYGEEFVSKNNLYLTDQQAYRWQELDPKRAFAMKMDESSDFNIPYFAFLLPLLFDIEDYKLLEKNSKEQDNYKLLSLDLPLDEQGNYAYDYNEALKFYNMMANALPSWVGLVLSPMEVTEFNFNKTGKANEASSVARAESDFYSAAGVSQLLFNSEKSSSATIGNSVKIDEEVVFAIHRQIERVVNKKLKEQSGKPVWKINILDVTVFNQEKYLDNIIKASTYGAPVKLAIPSILGFSPSDTQGLGVLEEVLDIVNTWQPLKSSNTQSSKDSDDKGGRPKSDDDDLSESGENTRDNDNRKEE